MGQKINPLGFRLGTTQDHHSVWFAQPKKYSEDLEEDKKIRDFIQNFVKDNIQKIIEKKIKENNRKKKVKQNRQQILQKLWRMEGLDAELSGITRIEIKKGIDIQKTRELIQVRIYLAFPKLLEESPTEALEKNLEKEFNSVNRKIKLATTIIAEPYRNPIILAQYIVGQLKQRVPFQKAMEGAIQKTKKTKTKGIQVKIAGRLGGKDIARVKWIRKGRVPLQTIRAKIDYCSYPYRTKYGVLGIKIWIFRDKN